MRQRPDALMIFAAGFGKRMAPLTDSLPKPLIEVAGRPLLDHALALAEGFATVVVNTHYRAPQIEAHLQGRARTIHEPTLLETGGGLKNALPVLNADPVVTLNSDAVWAGANPMAELLAAWQPERMEGLLLLIAPERAHGHHGGDFTATGGRLSRGGPLIYAGLQVLKTERIARHFETIFSMNAIWDGMIRDGSLHGQIYSGHWCDVGRPKGIALAEAMLLDRGDVHQ